MSSSHDPPPPELLIANGGNHKFIYILKPHITILNRKMDSEGIRTASNPSAMLATLLCKRTKLHDELGNIEKQLYDMETSYLQDPSQCGNVLKGFEGFLSSSKTTSLLKRSRKFQPEDRLFSLSSLTSPAVEEVAREGGMSANGPGKQKRGRGPREGKRRQLSSDADFDYELDDPDLMI